MFKQSGTLMSALLTTLFLFPMVQANAKNSFKLIHTSDLVDMLKSSPADVAVFDANNEGTRNKDGIIPGATLLESSSGYDTKILPKAKDKTLVFYCANTRCTASHRAAKKAMGAGYKNVTVYADGIQGWVKAGQPVEKPAKN